MGVVLAVVIGLGVRAARGSSTERDATYTELLQIAQAGQATAVEVSGDRFLVRQAGGVAVTAVVDEPTLRQELVTRFAGAGASVDFASREEKPRAAAAVLPVVILAAVGFALYAVSRRRSPKVFSDAKTGVSRSPVRFADVAGMHEVKQELAETVEFLKSPERFARLGGRPPRGVLLTGEPGTGKTLLARAVACEAGVRFLSASGSSFQEMFVGVGASRVRALFAEARKAAPCIVFIDEIDAVGRARAKGNGDSASAEHDQTLNQLLVEMDGFDHATGIVVIASTNRADMLDPALLRPGRFDRKITVPLPDVRGREEILNVHAGPIPLEGEVDLGFIARSTPGFSGADLANLLNEAAILAAREGAEAVDETHIDRARDRVLMGLERKGVLVDEDERYATAVHEAGHVAVGLLAANCDPVHKVSILPRGRALGVTQALPEKDRLMYRKEYLEDQICMLMGGRAAEMVILGTMTAGASDDIQRASTIAWKMVAELGMSHLGPICVGDGHPSRSPALLDRVDETARALTEAQLARAVDIVTSRRAEIEALVQALLRKETLGSDEIEACFPADRRQRAAQQAA
ncbi:ATP-dependent zinc metalloprotease FtsH [Sorangium sp. So ce315]|uniref:ATP-dependent zinc metalloprotease FtsH n=1 Tax=Sorangium sp. So ce315 TaxID=3133299 RepID=UPI003F6019AC